MFFFPRCCPLILDGSCAKPEVNCILNNCLVQVLPTMEMMTPPNGNGKLAIPSNCQGSLSPHTLEQFEQMAKFHEKQTPAKFDKKQQLEKLRAEYLKKKQKQTDK